MRRLGEAIEEGSTHRGLFTTQPSCCSNQGVTCGSIPGTSSYASVLSIDLGGLGLSGSLPSEIGYLNGMKNFSMGSNYISGSIPSTVGDMTSLRYLDLGLNRLKGTIPSSIGDLTSLEVLILFQNSLSGSIPASIGSLQSLTVLFIDTNSLSGSIPATIGSLSLLKVLSLYDNHLTGTIPDSVGILSSLEILYLDNNSLTGTIPATISSLTAMHTLILELNYLTMGSATTVPTTTFSQYTQDHTLDISENCLAYTSIQYPHQSANATRCIRKLYETVLSSMPLICLILLNMCITDIVPCYPVHRDALCCLTPADINHLTHLSSPYETTISVMNCRSTKLRTDIITLYNWCSIELNCADNRSKCITIESI